MHQCFRSTTASLQACSIAGRQLAVMHNKVPCCKCGLGLVGCTFNQLHLHSYIHVVFSDLPSSSPAWFAMRSAHSCSVPQLAAMVASRPDRCVIQDAIKAMMPAPKQVWLGAVPGLAHPLTPMHQAGETVAEAPKQPCIATLHLSTSPTSMVRCWFWLHWDWLVVVCADCPVVRPQHLV